MSTLYQQIAADLGVDLAPTGPVCLDGYEYGECQHQSCQDLPLDPMLDCTRHGLQAVVDVSSFTGFAGGTSYVYTLGCGCLTLDESDDLAAAR